MKRSQLATGLACLALLGLRAEQLNAQSNQSRPGMWAPKLNGPALGKFRFFRFRVKYGC